MAKARNVTMKALLAVLALALCYGLSSSSATVIRPRLSPSNKSGRKFTPRIGGGDERNRRLEKAASLRATGQDNEDASSGALLCDIIDGLASFATSILGLGIINFCVGSFLGVIYARQSQVMAFLRRNARKIVAVAA
mmetsp:Transcript_74922/g.178199  ORF Transcript_74922/g.178199 Transcript_74922/m.178199 type:complete len:137 (+) Transcript_74922:106-516(+)